MGVVTFEKSCILIVQLVTYLKFYIMTTNRLLAIIIAFVTGGYLIPFSVALWRAHPETTKIFLLNLLLGWTVIGWIVALFWSLK